jgi:hypothetical protein
MALTPAERQRAYRLRNPYKLKTTTIVVDGVKYTIPNNAMKPGSAKGFIKFLNKLEKNPTIENYRNLVAKLPKDVANQVRNYRYYLQGIKSGSFSGEETGEKLKKLFQELDLPKKSTNFLKNVTTADIKAEIIKTSATPKRADDQLRTSFNKVIKINKEFKRDPKITLEQLTKKLYGPEFTKGDDTVKLRLATTTSDDVAKYLQALDNARKTPKGMSAQWSPPSGNKLKEIMAYIGSQTEGFRFREGTLRKYKFSIRDAALNLAPNTTENLRNRLKGTTGVIDEAVGLSATFKNAPGYTELGQIISEDLNIKKGTQIDKKFSSLLENVINGEIDVEEINKFNKKSQAFAKANKIDTPILNIGGDPTKDIKYFTKLSKEAQKNVLDLAKGEKGFSIKSSAAPFGMLADKLDAVRASPELYKKLVDSIEKAPQACRAILNYSTGGISTTCAAAIKADPVKAATALEEIKPTSAALGKVRNAARSFLSFMGLGKGEGVKIFRGERAGASGKMAKYIPGTSEVEFVPYSDKLKGRFFTTSKKVAEQFADDPSKIKSLTIPQKDFNIGTNIARRINVDQMADQLILPRSVINKLKDGTLKYDSPAFRNILRTLGKGKIFTATAAVGAGAGALVKAFRNDDPETYLTNDKQANAMILDTADQLEREERQAAVGDAPELLDEANIGAELAVTGAAVPGASAVYQARRKPFKTRAAMGPARAALGPVGKALSGFATPLGIAATTPLNVASQVYAGDSVEDIATNPLNYLGPALAGTLTDEATRGMNQRGLLARSLRLGMNPATIRTASKFLGLPGLALSLGYEGYDQYKKYTEGRGFVYNLLNKDE